MWGNKFFFFFFFQNSLLGVNPLSAGGRYMVNRKPIFLTSLHHGKI